MSFHEEGNKLWNLRICLTLGFVWQLMPMAFYVLIILSSCHPVLFSSVSLIACKFVSYNISLNELRNASICPFSIFSVWKLYRTRVSLGSNLWVRFSLTNRVQQDLVQTKLMIHEDINSILKMLIGHSKAMWKCHKFY